MNNKEFNVKVIKEFGLINARNINPAIYLNPNHVEYWTKYKLEEYDWCLAYLRENKNLFIDKDYDNLLKQLKKDQDEVFVVDEENDSLGG